MSDQNTLPPAAWYADPQDPASLRFWDGAAWTDQTRPLVPEPVAPQPVAEPAPAVQVAPEPVVAQPVAVEPVAEVITPQPAIQETVGYTAAGPAVTETVVDQSLGYQAVTAEPVVPVVSEPAVADPLYSGFAAEVAGLSDATPAAPVEVTEVAVDAGGDVVVVTTETLPGLRVVSIVGPVMGVAVRPHAELADVSGFGGFGPADLAGLLHTTRSEALSRLYQAAAEAGATAVVGVRIDSSDVAGTITEVVAYGTAVVTAPE